MNIQHPVKIAGVGKYVPDNIVTSEDLEKAHGIRKGVSEKYSGVLERRVVTHESNGYMGAMALKMALERASISIEELDLLISASATYDYIIPNQSSVILNELVGGTNATVPCTDINSTCLGFITSFDCASKLLDGKRFKKIAIVTSELTSKGLDPGCWETFTLFGDGAAAAILEFDEEGTSGVIQADMKTYPEGTFLTIIKGGGMKNFFKDHPYDPAFFSFSMEGINVLRLARKTIPSYVEAFFSDLGMDISDVDLVIPHQASKVGLAMFRKMFRLDADKVVSNIETHGNCISASVPMCLFDAVEAGKLEKGQTCLLIGTSAGFSIGGVLFKY